GPGGSGDAGGGVCLPSWLGGGCVQYSPTSGGAGGTLLPFTDTIPASPAITTVSVNLPGITVASIGGNGGTGGSYIGISGNGAAGGAAGAGGEVTVINNANVTTQGGNAYGMF